MVYNKYNNATFSFGGNKNGGDFGVPVTHEDVPKKKELDQPSIETKIDFIVAKKDGKLWVKHTTIISDWKPATYYEVAFNNKRELISIGQQGRGAR